jgi:hypothetical protein
VSTIAAIPDGLPKQQYQLSSFRDAHLRAGPESILPVSASILNHPDSSLRDASE